MVDEQISTQHHDGFGPDSQKAPLESPHAREVMTEKYTSSHEVPDHEDHGLSARKVPTSRTVPHPTLPGKAEAFERLAAQRLLLCFALAVVAALALSVFALAGPATVSSVPGRVRSSYCRGGKR